MQLVADNVAVPGICRGEREDGVNPSQPRYCIGYSASMRPSAIGGEGACRRFEAEARKPAAAKSHHVAVSAG